MGEDKESTQSQPSKNITDKRTVLYDKSNSAEMDSACKSQLKQAKQSIRLTKSVDSLQPENNCKSKFSQEPHSTKPNKHKLRSTKSNDLEEIHRAGRGPEKNGKTCKLTKQINAEKANGGVQDSKTNLESRSPVESSNFFDPYDEVYMANACCECMHYRWATAVVGILEIIFLITWAGLMAAYYSTIGSNQSARSIIISQSIVGVVMLASILLMLAGVIFERYAFLYPHLILQVLGVGAGLALTVLAVVVMAVGNTSTVFVFGFIFGADQLPVLENRFGPIWPFCLAVLFDFMAAVGVWFYVLVKGYYDYLQDKGFYEKLTKDKHSIKLTDMSANNNASK